MAYGTLPSPFALRMASSDEEVAFLEGVDFLPGDLLFSFSWPLKFAKSSFDVAWLGDVFDLSINTLTFGLGFFFLVTFFVPDSRADEDIGPNSFYLAAAAAFLDELEGSSRNPLPDLSVYWFSKFNFASSSIASHSLIILAMSSDYLTRGNCNLYF